MGHVCLEVEKHVVLGRAFGAQLEEHLGMEGADEGEYRRRMSHGTRAQAAWFMAQDPQPFLRTYRP